ncbi:MAG: hypothetical protein M1831_002317 [Alyxoria varia]|nr:MAG: hypothetical protein M1831_002317 [Alyxoria varia]
MPSASILTVTTIALTLMNNVARSAIIPGMQFKLPGKDDFHPELITSVQMLNCQTSEHTWPPFAQVEHLRDIFDSSLTDANGVVWTRAHPGVCTVLAVSNGIITTKKASAVPAAEAGARVSVCVPNARARRFLLLRKQVLDALNYFLDNCPPASWLGGTTPFNPRGDPTKDEVSELLNAFIYLLGSSVQVAAFSIRWSGKLIQLLAE